jgi:hypothetical protein
MTVYDEVGILVTVGIPWENGQREDPSIVLEVGISVGGECHMDSRVERVTCSTTKLL